MSFIKIPKILLPSNGIDLTKWAVIACDQYTSQEDYWLDIMQMNGDAPTTLKMIFPEVWLENDDAVDRIENIKSTMNEYMENDIFTSFTGFMYIERRTPHADKRRGLIVMIDLEKYDYTKEATTPIRATEGTVADRIPPRLAIRRDAPLELPHIMMLMDDEDDTIMGGIEAITNELKIAYDFELSGGGGSIRGWKVTDEKIIKNIMDGFDSLEEPSASIKKYNMETNNPLVLAAGDGNHSLATAKVHWENIKKENPSLTESEHPARFALVEIVNVHDSGLDFEPIHRVLFDIDSNSVKEKLNDYLKSMNITIRKADDLKSAMDEIKSGHKFVLAMAGELCIYDISNPDKNMSVATVQDFINDMETDNIDVSVDYIHGDDVACELGFGENNAAFLLPVIDKSGLFKSVLLDGALPRKTFSMGHANEKRYYIEARKIVVEGEI